MPLRHRTALFRQKMGRLTPQFPLRASESLELGFPKPIVSGENRHQLEDLINMSDFFRTGYKTPES